MKPRTRIRTTFQPDRVREVDEATFTDLNRRGLVLEVLADEVPTPEPVEEPVEDVVSNKTRKRKVSGLGSKDPDVKDVESPKADDDHEAL